MGIGIIYFAAFAIVDLVVVSVKEGDVDVVNIIGQLCQPVGYIIIVYGIGIVAQDKQRSS